jgi:uroporphyrin-III C-methyltransferase
MHSNATVVIYMGMKKLAEIASAYINAGKGDIPAAIIQHASLPNQKSAKGKVSDLVSIAADNQLTYPAIIIIGDVVNVKN